MEMQNLNDPRYFLGEGERTSRGEITRVHLTRARSMGNSTTRRNIGEYIQKFRSDVNKKLSPRFRMKTAEQILEEELTSGCSDVALAFCVLSREAGIPTRYVETFEEENIINPSSHVSGHVFLDLYLDDQWFPYEPLRGFMKSSDYSLSGRNYILVGKGLDFTDLVSPHGEKMNLDSVDKLMALRNKMSSQIKNR